MAGKRYQEGTVEITGKREPSWTGYYYVYDPQGKRHRRSVNLGPAKGMNRKQAMSKLRPIVERETNQPMQPKPLKVERHTSGEDTFGWFWKERYIPSKPKWSAGTKDTIERNFNTHILPRIGKMKLMDFDRFFLQSLLNGFEAYSASVIDQLRTYLKAAFELAFDEGLIPKNPMKKVTAPNSLQQSSERFLTIEEMEKFFAELPIRDRLICRFACVMGLRPGEIFGLTWADYNLMESKLRIDRCYTAGRIQQTKTKTSKTTTWCPPSIVQGLAEWRKVSFIESPYIFPTRNGAPQDGSSYLQHVIKPAAIRAGIMPPRSESLAKGQRRMDRENIVNFQSMRRTCATWCGDQASVKDMQTIMRHAKAETTLKYYQKPIPESVKAALIALDARISGVILADLPISVLQ